MDKLEFKLSGRTEALSQDPPLYKHLLKEIRIDLQHRRALEGSAKLAPYGTYHYSATETDPTGLYSMPGSGYLVVRVWHESEQP